MLHSSTCNLNGVKYSNRCSSARTPNANNNIFYYSRGLFGGVLVGNRRSRLLANNTKLCKQRSVVHFNHKAVCNKWQFMALDVPLFNKVHHIVQRVKYPRLLVAPKPKLCQKFVRLHVSRHFTGVVSRKVVGNKRQRSLRNKLRVKLTDSSSGKVARVSKNRFASFLLALVQRFKIALKHNYFAPHLCTARKKMGNFGITS